MYSSWAAAWWALCIAHQLLERGVTAMITVLDKESTGGHSSGRNSATRGLLTARFREGPGVCLWCQAPQGLGGGASCRSMLAAS